MDLRMDKDAKKILTSQARLDDMNVSDMDEEIIIGQTVSLSSGDGTDTYTPIFEVVDQALGATEDKTLQTPADKIAQKFLATKDNVTAVTLKLKENGTPGGTNLLTVSLYLCGDSISDDPTGDALASEAVAAADISGTAGDVEVTFTTPALNLTVGKYYAIVIENHSDFKEDGSNPPDSTDYVGVYKNQGDVYTKGKITVYDESEETWTDDGSGYDLRFIIHSYCKAALKGIYATSTEASDWSLWVVKADGTSMQPVLDTYAIQNVDDHHIPLADAVPIEPRGSLKLTIDGSSASSAEVAYDLFYKKGRSNEAYIVQNE